jgi:hypothetical protein
MLLNKSRYPLCFIIFTTLLIVGAVASYSQNTKPAKVDSLHINVKDSLKKESKSALDTIVKYQAKDSLLYNLKTKTMRLKSDAKIDYKLQKLESDIIILDFDKSALTAIIDSSKNPKKRTYPKFYDNGQSFVGSRIAFNFKTSQGSISVGETELSDAFYYGSRIKRVSEDELFVQDGCYTNCDDPHPHYYFGSPKMKVVAKDKVFIDPIIFYVEDLPIFILPIGLYFPNKTGRQSGLIIPSFFFSKNRGVAIENLGLYLALSDYYDTQFAIDFFSKGGYNLKNSTRWNKKKAFSGHAEFQFGKTRFHPDDEYKKNWSLALSHSQELTPQSRLEANLQFSSQDFNRATSNKLSDRMRQNISSRASYSESFDNGASYSIFFNREQDIINDTYSQSFPSLSVSIPNLYPLKNIVSPASSLDWLRNLTFSYSGSANFDEVRSRQSDSSYLKNKYKKISHSPSISINPKLGYFNVTPYLSFNANNYFRRLTKKMDPSDSSIIEKTEDGFFTEYNYSLGVNVSTTLWGVLKTNMFGINSLRHQFKPSIGFSYSPDLSDSKFGFYDKFYNLKTKSYETYSRFEKDRGGIASRTLQNNISYRFDNGFSAAIKQDTGLDKRVQLFNLSLSGSYNIAADSLKFSDVNVSFSAPPIGAFNFNGSATFTLYDQVLTSLYPKAAPTYVKVDNLLISEGKGLARLTNFSFNMTTSFSSQGFLNSAQKPIKKDSMTLGDRFSQRVDSDEEEFDMWGDDSPGYSPINPPWSLNMGMNFSYSKPTPKYEQKNLSLLLGLSANLTATWSLSANTSVDLIGKNWLSPSINIVKDLHCWSLTFDWYPIGVNRGFYLRFAAKAPTLQDLKIEKRNNPLYN